MFAFFRLPVLADLSPKLATVFPEMKQEECIQRKPVGYVVVRVHFRSRRTRPPCCGQILPKKTEAMRIAIAFFHAVELELGRTAFTLNNYA